MRSQDPKNPGNEVAEHEQTQVVAADVRTEEDKRIAARRRFLRMGAGGSAMLVTIVHKRAFAAGMTIKKGAIASACVSLMGVPDIKGLDSKRALQLSAMGSPKHVVCNAKETVNTCSTPQGTASKYYDLNRQQVSYFKSNQFKNGCGDLQTTVDASYNYRLYQKGYCPVVYDSTGLHYKSDAMYYTIDKKTDELMGHLCKMP